jgi:Protein of unknown function (DUF3667)
MRNLFRKKEDHFDYELSRQCLTCGAVFAGQYCPKCGERVVDPEHRSLRYFFSELLNAFTFIDGKFFRSLRTLAFKPGQLSRDITDGIRQPYMKPIAFFFVANFIYFLLPLFQTFNSSLNIQMHNTPYAAYANEMVQKHLSESGDTIEDFSVTYNNTSTSWAKLLLFLLVLYMFPSIAIINYSRQVYTLDHLLFSLEFMTYLLFIGTILLGGLVVGIFYIGKFLGFDWRQLLWDQYVMPILIGLLLYFFIMASRTFYGFPLWRRILSTTLLIGATYCALMMYRFTLFIVTMWEVG